MKTAVATFNGLDYVASYSDLIKAFGPGASSTTVQDSGAAHYITYGDHEGRTTTFNGLDYVASYQDLIKAFGANSDAGAYHYIEHGENEGTAVTTFDGLDYIAGYRGSDHGVRCERAGGGSPFHRLWQRRRSHDHIRRPFLHCQLWRTS